MRKFAIILQGRVIEVVESYDYVKWGKDQNGNTPLTVECTGKDVAVGMLYDKNTGEFSFPVPQSPPSTPYTPEPVPEPEYVPSNTEIYENQMIIMSALADIAEMQMGVE